MKNIKCITITTIVVFTLLNIFAQTSTAQSTDTVFFDETLNKSAETTQRNGNNLLTVPLEEDGLAFSPIGIEKVEYNGNTQLIAYGYNQLAKVEVSNGSLSFNDVSETFNNRLSYLKPYYRTKDNRLAFTGTRFYIATDANTIVALDWNLQVIDEIVLPFSPIKAHLWRTIAYNSNNGKLYYLSYNDFSNSTDFYVINPSNHQIDYSTSYNGKYADIEFNQERSVYYISIDNYLRVFDNSSNSLIKEIDLKAPAGPIAYIKTPNYHKLTAFPGGNPVSPDPYAHIINADNDQIINSIQLDHYGYSIAKTNVQNNICYATYGDIDMNGDNEYGITAIDLNTNNLSFDNQWLNSYSEAVDLDIPNSSSYQAAVITRNCKLLTLDNNNTIELQFENNSSLNNYEGLISISDKFLLSNSKMNQIELIDENFDLGDILHTAGTAFESKYNSSNGKVYFYADHKDSWLSFGNKSQGELMGNRIYVYDPDQQTWDKIILDDVISGMAFNETDDILYAISRSSSELYVIDAYTNELINTVDIPGNFGLDMAWSSEQKLYTVAQWHSNAVSIHVFNTQNDGGINPQYINHNVFSIPTSGFQSFSYIDEETNDVYFSISSNKYPDTPGKIVKVDSQNDTFEQFDVEQPSYFEYLDDKVFSIKNTGLNAELNVLDINDNQQETVYFDFPVNLIESAPNLNYILLSELHPGLNISKIYVVSADSLTINKEIEIPSRLSGMKYNPKNSTLYALAPINGANDLACEVYAISVTKNDVDVYQTDFSTANRYGGMFGIGNMTLSFDENYDNVYIPTGYFNHIFELECDNEFLNVNNGWTWQWYPRLERQGNNPVDLTDFYDDNFYPNSESFTVWNETGYWSAYNGENQDWAVVFFDEIQSTKGYKVYQENEGSYVEMTGSIIDPETTIELETGDNWLGYFLPEPHDAFDALKGVLEDIDAIRTQYWSCFKEYTSTKDNTEPVWVCAVKDGVRFTAFEFGDMVEVNATAQAVLKWNQNADAVKKKDIPEAQHFSYTELQDYQSIFVEVDTTQVDEIATYLNGDCVGAAVVLDTLQEVRTYTPEGAEGTITFQVWSEGSKSRRVIKDYRVLQPQYKNGKPIQANNNDRYYMVSLKGTTGQGEATNFENKINVYPNPSTGQVTVNIVISKQTTGSLQLFSSKGVLLKTLHRGELSKGNHTFKINAQDNLPAGVYLYTFKTNEGVTNGKIVIE